MNKFKSIDVDYRYIWPFSIIQYYNEHINGKKFDLNELSANDIFCAYNTIRGREADVLTRYIRNGETLDSLAKTHNVTRARIGAIRDRALRIIGNKIRKSQSELKDKEDILNTMIAEKIGNDVDAPIFIDQLNLSIRARNCLIRAGIKTLDELKKIDSYKLYRTRNLGRRAYNEIVNKLDELGIKHDFVPWPDDVTASTMAKRVYRDHIMRTELKKETNNER